MVLSALRDDKYALENWTLLRPFFCRLSPEFIWNEMRIQIIEELNEEIQANTSHSWEYATYFTYPSDEQMEHLHEQGEDLFFSEIREVVGYRSAEALATLAGMIRLESQGSVRLLLQELFDNLWQKFSQFEYGHGYDKEETQKELVLMLASNNVFGLVHDRTWSDAVHDYFLKNTDLWSGTPLRKLYGGVLKVLGETRIEYEANKDNPIISGTFNLDQPEYTLEQLRDLLFWQQGRPESFESSSPQSIFYALPYHMVKFTGDRKLRNMANIARDPFTKTAIHFLLSLCLRNMIVACLGIGKSFTLQQAADACTDDIYCAKVVLGQMIKVGLVDFDSSKPWDSDSQQFICREEATFLL
jgi:hypothetical protein